MLPSGASTPAVTFAETHQGSQGPTPQLSLSEQINKCSPYFSDPRANPVSLQTLKGALTKPWAAQADLTTVGGLMLPGGLCGSLRP